MLGDGFAFVGAGCDFEVLGNGIEAGDATMAG